MFHRVLSKPLNVEIKTQKQCHSSCSEDIIVDFQHISHISFHAYFTYLTDISYINAFIVDSKQVSVGLEGFQKI